MTALPAAAGGAGADNGAEMMKRLKICCFLGLALLLLTLPVRGAELPPEVENGRCPERPVSC